MHKGLRCLSFVTYATSVLGASALGLSACAAGASDLEPSATDSRDEALGAATQAASSIPCKGNCDCPLDEVCSIPKATCVPNPALDFGPPPLSPICVDSCQCRAAANGLPYCVAGDTGACKASVPPYVPKSGSWNNPARSGWGLAISGGEKSPMYTNIKVVWYTYKTTGEPIWFKGELAPTSAKYTGNLYSSTFSSASQSTTATSRGTMTFTPSSSTTGTFSWKFDSFPDVVSGGVSGSEQVKYLAFGGGGSPTPPLTGQWLAYKPFSASPTNMLPFGIDLFIDVQGSTAVPYVGLYDTSGQPTWVNGSGASSSAGFTASLYKVTGTNLYPGSTGTPSTSAQQVGSLTVQNISAAYDAARFSLSMPASYIPQIPGLQYLWRQTK